MATITWGVPETAGTGSVTTSGTSASGTCYYRSSAPSNYFRVRGTCVIPCCSSYSFTFGYNIDDASLSMSSDEIKYTATGAGFSKSYQFPITYSSGSGSRNVSETVDPPRDITITIDLALGYGNHYSGTNSAYLNSFVGVSTPIVPTLSNLTPTITTVNTPTQFTVTTSTACPQVSYQWNFGDGGTSTSAPPVTHTYTTAGAYQLTVTASNTAGTTSPLTETIGVRGLPTAHITPLERLIGVNSKVNFSSDGSTIGYPPYSSSANLLYEWSCVNSSSQQSGFYYTDGTTSTSADPHIYFTTIDTYTVSLRVRNGYGYSTWDTTHVYVLDKAPPTDDQARDDILIITTNAMITKRLEDV